MTRTEVADADLLRGGLRLAVAVALLVVVPLAGRGATIGQQLVMLRPQGEAGEPPSPAQRLVRSVTGAGGYVLLGVLGSVTGSSLLDGAAVALGVASLVVATLGDHRGLSGIVARIRVVDSRVPRAALTDAERWAAMPEVRRLGFAVAAGAAVLHLLVVALLDVMQTSVLAAGAVLVVLLVGAVAQVAFLVLNGLAMTRREGRTLGNMLTLLLGLAVVTLTVLTVAAIILGPPSVAVLVGAVWVLLAYFGLLFWSFVLFGLLYARRDPAPGADAVIVLGSGIFGTRVPPLLAARLARGREVLEDELARGGDAVLVCSGGQGPGEDVPEAVAMADHLLAAGTRPTVLRRETASTTTDENVLLSLRLLRAEGRGERVVVATNDYHAFRAAIITREQGLVAQVVGAPTARYFLPSAILREFIGVLVRHPWPHLAVVTLIAALAALLALGAR